MAKVLLDSTFLLPTLGVMVEEIGDDELSLMVKLKDQVEYYCLNQSLVEVLGKVARSLVGEPRVLGIVELGYEASWSLGLTSGLIQPFRRSLRPLS